MRPSRISATRSASASASVVSWVAYRPAAPASRRCRARSSRSCSRSGMSRCAVGSSNSCTCAPRAIARPSPTRCCSPPDSSAGRRSASPPMPRPSRIACASRRASARDRPCRWSGYATVSRAVRCGHSAAAWNTTPTSRRSGGSSRRSSADESAAQRDRPGLDRQEARDRREQRGLARAGRPEQRQHLPGSHGEIQPIEDEHRAVADADRAALDGRDGVFGHGRRRVHSASGIAARPTSPVSSTASAAVTVGSPSCWTFRTTTARVAVCEP